MDRPVEELTTHVLLIEMDISSVGKYLVLSIGLLCVVGIPTIWYTNHFPALQLYPPRN